ncbi:FAD-dependent oxidoreductase [Massilia violaceinigra]|uniref:FAD-dependent oxidoreductase n=1 Tax=Massilia violaceinigra TaxID=2045208 RepID=A0A2D2DQ30_9BURK|nr:FAD-binding oxidoreductase [Massilia violaceinigra]ATQ77088.1 FAD-dependent oxidoreductase [Massilia violaceinigra]
MTDALGAGDYYRATSPGEHYAPLAGQHDAAVCIVGAGFAGLATAIGLMERGVRGIVLLDAQRVGHGASGRNGGFVFGGFSQGERSLAASAGVEEARALYHMTLAAVERIRQRIAQYGIDCDAREDGVYLANWFDDARLLDEQQRFMSESMGVEWQRLSRAQLAGKLDSARYFGGLFEPAAFHFHPLKYAQGLARVLAQNGVRVHEESRVGAIVADGEGWRVTTAAGTVRAREVVVCCGGYIDKLLPTLSRAILPIATYVMVTEPLGERLHAAMRTGAAVYDTRFAFDYYRPLPDTRLLWGGRIAVRERSGADVARLLHQDMLKVYPQLAGVRVEHAWSGMMSYARHKMPQIGRLPDGLWYGMGFGGHGVAPTTLAGEVIAAAIAGDETALARFADWGLPFAGGPAGLAAAQLTYWYYELRDWMRQ